MQRGRGGNNRQRPHQVFTVRTEDRNDDLHFIDKAFGEERAQRPVN